jgi:hypothetical protein
VCCVLSGRGLCDKLITRPEASYRLWRVVACDHETSLYEEAEARAGLQSQGNKIWRNSGSKYRAIVGRKLFVPPEDLDCRGVTVFL